MARSLALALVAVALAGCDVPNVPLDVPLGDGPTVVGALKGVQTGTAIRVGLLGAPKAGSAQSELLSTTASGGSFSLKLPASPRLDFMKTDNESIVLTLTAYKDANGNKKYDATDEVLEAAAQSGTFRWFAEDGPAGSYKRGWNVYQSGTYTQNFSTAFDMNAGATTYRVRG